MSNSITYAESRIGKRVDYANNEMAWFRNNTVASSVMYSTAISFWEYDTKSNILTVQYRSSVTFYKYEGVPFSTMFALMSADSLGAFIAKEIKPNFREVNQ